MKRIITIFSILLLYQLSFGQVDKLKERVPKYVIPKLDDIILNRKVTDSTMVYVKRLRENLEKLLTNTDSIILLKKVIDDCSYLNTNLPYVWPTKQQLNWLMPELTTLFFDNIDIQMYEKAVKFQANRQNGTIDTIELAKLDSIYKRYKDTDSLMKSDFPKEFVNNTDLTNLKFITLLSKKSVGGKSISVLSIIIAVLLTISIVITILIFKKMKDEKKLKDEFKKQVGFLHGAIKKYKDLLNYALKDNFSLKSEKSKRSIISNDINAYDDETQNSIKTLEGLIDSFVKLQQKSSIENTQSANYKEFVDNLKEELEEKKKEIKEKDKTISILNTNLNKLNVLFEEATSESKKQPKQVVSEAINVSKYIFGEVMLTAGPRKKFSNEENADIDLGEDVSGFAHFGNKSLFWLLDGTSDSPVLKNPETKREYFSSRLLAQSLAYHLQNEFEKYNNFNSLVNTAIEKTKIEWCETLLKLPVTIQNKLKASIRKNISPICSATLVLGQLDLNGNFEGYRIGDSKILLYEKENMAMTRVVTSFGEKPKEDNDRIFFKLALDKENNLTIKYNKQPRYSIEKQENINTLIAISDGIGTVSETQLKLNYPKAANIIMKELPKFPNNTFDDKSLCILQIRKNNVTQNES